MDKPQKNLIEQIISASLARQSADRHSETPAGERLPDTPASENELSNSTQPPPQSIPPPKAEQGLVWLTGSAGSGTISLGTAVLNAAVSE